LVGSALGTAPLVVEHALSVARLGGEIVANRLRARPRLRLILPTGHTPLGLFAVLRAHAADGSLPTAEATLFALDEYVGLAADDPRSYTAYLKRELDGIAFAAFHSLEETSERPQLRCERHETLLDAAPIDLVVLGLGRDGHVAFDEPGSPIDAGVRVVALQSTTRTDAAADFGGIENVPTHAVTVGLKTLLRAREVVMLVSGAAKAVALRAMLEGERGSACPASLLREHPRLTLVCDADAARLLSARAGTASDRALVVLGHREPGASAERRISDETRARLARAARECRSSPPRVVILTGYTRTLHGLSEAEQMKAAWTVRETPALLEDAGRNTAENATRSLPLIRAIGDVRAVTVVTSGWHLRALYFFAPYHALGLRLSFAFAWHRPWLAPLLHELRGARHAAAERRAALAAMRLPPQPELPQGSATGSDRGGA
jgi:glucosamine-6-phosphate deaminase